MNKSIHPSTSPKMNAKIKKPGPLFYGLTCGAIGFVVAFIWGAWSVTQSLASSSTAAIGYLFVPVISMIAAVPLFIFGYCSYYIVDFFKFPGKKQLLNASFALGVSLALLIPIVLWVYNGLTLSGAIDEIDILRAEEIQGWLEKSDYRENQYVLEAVVSRNDIDADLLHNIAMIDSSGLHEIPHSLFFPFRARSNKKREWLKRSDFAVMRVIAWHPNVEVRTLLVLANSPVDYVLSAVASNNKTPPDILTSLHKKGGQITEWELARNPNSPPELLRELAVKGDSVVRQDLAGNPGLPNDIIKKFSQDKDEFVRMRLTFNPNLPPDVACSLVQDQSELVRDHVERRIEKELYPQCDRSEPIADPIAYLNDPVGYRKNCPPSRSEVAKKWCRGY